MHIRHTASHEIGQIYVPLANWLLAAATLGAVVGFGTSDALAGAYGIAVSLLMAITTLLAALVAIQWGYSPIIVIAVNGFFFIIDCVFFAANSTKFLEGGWFPLLLAGVIAFLMLTWRSGVRLVERARAKLRQPEEDLIETAVSRCQARLPGTAVFLASAPKGVPLALTLFVKHNHVLHQRVVLVTVLIEEAPRIADEDRAEVIEIIEGITRVILHFGFMQYPTIAEGLGLAASQGSCRASISATSPITSAARPSFQARTFPGCGSGGKRCLPSCSAMPSARPPFSACRRDRSSNSAPRSKSRDTPRSAARSTTVRCLRRAAGPKRSPIEVL